MTPQIVTERYVSNLLKSGKNKEFEILTISHDYSMVDNLCVGTYYQAVVGGPNKTKQSSVGVTPAQALRRALEKHGVTFR